MASLSTRRLKNGDLRFYVTFTEGGRGGVRHAPSFSDETIAKRFLGLVEALGNTWPDDDVLHKRGFGYLVKSPRERVMDARVSLVDYATAFIETRGKAGAQQKQTYRAQVRDHLAPYFDDVTAPAALADLRRGHMRAWQNHMTDVKGRSAKLVQNIRGLLIPMFRAACEPGEWGEPAVIATSPMEGLDAPTYVAPRTRYLHNPEHAAIFFAAAYDVDPDLADVLYVCCSFAGRWGETIALCDDAVHLGGNPHIEIMRKAQRVTGRGWSIVPGAKTDNGWRTLPVTPRAGAILAERCARGVGLLFPGPDGNLIVSNGNLWRDRWVPVRDEARRRGLPYDISIRGLRKTTLSMLAESGVDPVTLKAFAGHASAITTLNVYSDATGRGRDTLISNIGQFLPPTG